MSLRITKIQVRRDSLADWQAKNPVLSDGEPGFITDTEEFKIGNGVDAFVDLKTQTITQAIADQLQPILDNITALTNVSNNTSDITTVEASLSDIQTASTNISKIITVANNLESVGSSIDNVYGSLTAIENVNIELQKILNIEADLTALNNLNANIGDLVAVSDNLSQILSANADIQEAIDAKTIATNAANAASTSESNAEQSNISANESADDAKKQAQNTTSFTDSDGLTFTKGAKGYADDASNILNSAVAAKNAAQTSEDNSSTSENNALASKQKAEQWAEENEDVPVETGQFSAKHHAKKSEDSATQSEASRQVSDTKASEALTSASNASTSEDNALQSANNASTSESNAQTSADNASTSESNALTSANNASTSESNALTYKNDAETAKNLAETAYDNFDDRYLGSKATDPSTDNDGDALLEGALYWNSTDNELKVYNGTNWLAQNKVTGASMDAEVLIATESQTVFNSVYEVGQIFVYANGVLLPDTEYTATNGTSITLNEARSAGDEITIVKYDDLFDITSPATDEILQFNGTTWENRPLSNTLDPTNESEAVTGKAVGDYTDETMARTAIYTNEKLYNRGATLLDDTYVSTITGATGITQSSVIEDDIYFNRRRKLTLTRTDGSSELKGSNRHVILPAGSSSDNVFTFLIKTDSTDARDFVRLDYRFENYDGVIGSHAITSFVKQADQVKLDNADVRITTEDYLGYKYIIVEPKINGYFYCDITYYTFTDSIDVYVTNMGLYDSTKFSADVGKQVQDNAPLSIPSTIKDTSILNLNNGQQGEVTWHFIDTTTYLEDVSSRNSYPCGIKVSTAESSKVGFDHYSYTGLNQGYRHNVFQFQTRASSVLLTSGNCTVGFWINTQDFKDGVLSISDNCHFVPNHLGSFSDGNYEIDVLAEDGYWKFVRVKCTSFNNGYLILKRRQGASLLATNELEVKNIVWCDGIKDILPNVDYQRITDKYSNLVGKSCCLVGDSTTAGQQLARAVSSMAGVSDVWLAAVSGASIGDSDATNWIYEYKKMIIESDADFVIYNISSNDTNNTIGTISDYGDAGANSFYKWYMAFMEYILTNTSTVDASFPQTKIPEKGHFLCSWLTGDDSAQPARRQSAIDIANAVDEISRYWSCNYIDIHRRVGWTEETASIFGDGTHPQDEMHKRIAATQLHEINIYFEQGLTPNS